MKRSFTFFGSAVALTVLPLLVVNACAEFDGKNPSPGNDMQQAAQGFSSPYWIEVKGNIVRPANMKASQSQDDSSGSVSAASPSGTETTALDKQAEKENFCKTEFRGSLVDQSNCLERARQGKPLSGLAPNIDPSQSAANAQQVQDSDSGETQAASVKVTDQNLGTYFKMENDQSSKLSPEKLCFLPNGTYTLTAEPVYAENTKADVSSQKVRLTAESQQVIGCSFGEGFVAATHIAGGPDKWVRPARSGPITSDHGAWRSCSNCTNPHQGIDYGIPTGTPTLAARGGRVFYKGWADGYGHLVALHHTVNGVEYTSRYAHHSRITLMAQRGVQVSAGTVLGESGCTGTCYGAHLHFDLAKGRKTAVYYGADVKPHDLSSVFR